MKMISSAFLLGSSLLLFSAGYAGSNLIVKLNKISFQVDRAEIFAANCVIEAKESQTINPNCSKANTILQKLNRKLDRIEALNFNSSDEIALNIKQLRTKIDQVHQELTEADVATGNYKSNSPLNIENQILNN